MWKEFAISVVVTLILSGICLADASSQTYGYDVNSERDLEAIAEEIFFLNTGRTYKSSADVELQHQVEDPDEALNTLQLIRSRGFLAEAHQVTTEDGYILTLHRIVNPHAAVNPGRARPVLLQHGLLACSSDWIINSPGGMINSTTFHNEDDDLLSEWFRRRSESGGSDVPADVSVGNNLGFVLASAGFDVWLGNSRGNRYSLNHTSLSPKSRKFWEFSFDELALLDLPAVISYILSSTSSPSIGYVGHSQGTLIGFALLATKPEYSDLLHPVIALAPVAEVGHIVSPIKFIAPLEPFFFLKGGPFIAPYGFITKWSKIACDHRAVDALCENVLFILCGWDSQELNSTRIPVYLAHTPAGTSAWNLVHYAQMYRHGNFGMFDYGAIENFRKYGQTHPPQYSLERINSTELALFWARNDFLADPNDVARLKARLTVPLIADHLMPDESFNHLDFIYSERTGTLVNPYVLDLLLKHT